jgi:hypothetical protein
VDQYVGTLGPEQLAELFPQRHDISTSEFRTARAAWQAFTAPEPFGLVELLENGTAALPFLNGAIKRHLEQFPGLRGGLSRTESQALQFADSGLHGFAEMFSADQRLEQRIFMGDDTYRQYLRRLYQADVPLMNEFNDRFEITELGRGVLKGEKDHVVINGIDRWMGGVHLHLDAPVWRWDPERGKISS